MVGHACADQQVLHAPRCAATMHLRYLEECVLFATPRRLIHKPPPPPALSSTTQCSTAHSHVQEIMRNNAKNYQLWNHRRKCALRAGPSCLPRELDFVQRALSSDDKNYHAWSHRMAMVSGVRVDEGSTFTSRLLWMSSVYGSEFQAVLRIIATSTAIPTKQGDIFTPRPRMHV